MSLPNLQQPRRRCSAIVQAVLACGIALGLGSVATMAGFATGDTQDPGSIRAGTLDVSVDGELIGLSNLDGSTVRADWQVDDMITNEWVALALTTTNSGNVPLDVRISGFAQGTLGDRFRFRLYEDATPNNLHPLTNVDATYRQANCDGGTQVTPSWVTFGSDPANPTPFLSNKVRLAPGESKAFCIQMAVTTLIQYNVAYLNTKGTAAFIVRGTQEGAP